MFLNRAGVPLVSSHHEIPYHWSWSLFVFKYYSFAPSCGIYEETGTFLYHVAETLSADKGEHEYHESSKESIFF